ncbi:MAG TPA: hypothetical protein DHW82_00745 [Spirochaetia bacterium]|nr:MAG: hypothetical protein A2Y41_13505 [Spirochaetes bacterium GWB1_36_13]HCL55525.1 hypothetical protein [Spirochaetia bacterium]
MEKKLNKKILKYRPIQTLKNDLLKDRIIHQEFFPRKELRELVACYWVIKSREGSFFSINQKLLPDNCVDIVFDLKKRSSYVAGLWDKTSDFVISGGRDFAGIRFLPKAIPFLLKTNALELTNRCSLYNGFETASVCPNLKTMVEKVLNLNNYQTILEIFNDELLRFFSDFTIHPKLSGMLDLILKRYGNIRIEKLSDLFFVSEKQISRYFKHDIGISPKKFIRIVRFQSQLKFLLASGKNFQKPDLGYYDQSHMIKDFQSFLNQSPLAVLKMSDFYNT